MAWTRFIDLLPAAARLVMDKAPFLFGVGLIENAHDETLHVEAIPRETLFAREAELQAIAVPAAPAGVRRAGLQRGWRG